MRTSSLSSPKLRTYDSAGDTILDIGLGDTYQDIFNCPPENIGGSPVGLDGWSMAEFQVPSDTETHIVDFLLSRSSIATLLRWVL